MIGVRGKLSPRYIGPFEVMERIEEVFYKLALPQSLEGIDNVFHISQLREYIPDNNHIVDHSELDFKPNPSHEKQPLAIIDRCVKTLKNKAIPLVLVSWNRHAPGEAIWEREDIIQERYPYLLTSR